MARRVLAGSWPRLYHRRRYAPELPQPLSAVFQAALAAWHLPEIRFHDLRYSCATLLLSKGQRPEFVQELLGHATIAVTLDTYSHVLPGMGDGLTDAMDEALG